MGRELKRKEAKKNHENVKDINRIDNNQETVETKKLLITLGIVFGIMILAYLMIGIFVTKEIKLDWFNKTVQKDDTSVPKNTILASDIFSKNKETYYVYCYDFDKEENAIETLITNKLKDDTIYRVDITSGFNSNYVGDISNKNAQKVEELKINGVTIIKISNGKNINYVEGIDNIKNFINN